MEEEINQAIATLEAWIDSHPEQVLPWMERLNGLIENIQAVDPNNLAKANHKLSKTQKQILLRIAEVTKLKPYKPVPWVPEKLFGTLTPAKRTTISHAIKTLEKRKLIVRRAESRTRKHTGQRHLRTAMVLITPLGLQVVRPLIVEA